MDAIREAYDQLYVYTMDRPGFILQRVVDAFAVQHANDNGPVIGVVFGLVGLGSLGIGAVLFVSSFVVMNFVWMHIVVKDPKDIGLGDGVMVVGEGFIIGSTLGAAGLIISLYKLWPRSQSKQS